MFEHLAATHKESRNLSGIPGREPERVSRDVRRGYITPEVAAQVYGHAETEAAPGTRSDEPAKIS